MRCSWPARPLQWACFISRGLQRCNPAKGILLKTRKQTQLKEYRFITTFERVIRQRKEKKKMMMMPSKFDVTSFAARAVAGGGWYQ